MFAIIHHHYADSLCNDRTYLPMVSHTYCSTFYFQVQYWSIIYVFRFNKEEFSFQVADRYWVTFGILSIYTLFYKDKCLRFSFSICFFMCSRDKINMCLFLILAWVVVFGGFLNASMYLVKFVFILFCYLMLWQTAIYLAYSFCAVTTIYLCLYICVWKNTLNKDTYIHCHSLLGDSCNCMGSYTSRAWHVKSYQWLSLRRFT